MDADTRFVLIKPGDVLLIGNVRHMDADTAELVRRFKELTGVQAVVVFADDISIDKLDDLQLLDLAERAAARGLGINPEETDAGPSPTR